MFDGRWRRGVDRGMAPVGSRLGKLGITADLLTAIGLMFAIATAVAVVNDQMRWAFVFFLLSAFPDLLDGAVARATQRASSRGAFFDSVADRLSDCLYMFSFAWYLVDNEPGHIVLLPMAVLAMAFLISYQRAKAESLGFYAKGGVMERAERMVLIGIALAIPSTMITILWVMLALTSLTVVQRFIKVWIQASANLVPRRRIYVAERWETWREQTVEQLRTRRQESLERRSARRQARQSRRALRSSRSTRP